MFRTGRFAAGLMTLAAAATLGISGGASAGPVPPPGGGSWDHVYKATGVEVDVDEHGDWVVVCDTSANGHSAWVTVADTVDFHGYSMKVTSGAGTCEGHYAGDGANYNLTENQYVSLHFDGNGGSYASASFLNDH